MIKELSIRNFSIITELVQPLELGMIALTGETGAGKSILIDALGLVLGDRGDTRLIRSGQVSTEVSAVFGIKANELFLAWLKSRGLEQGEECVLKRVLSREGRSRGYINGHFVSIQILREAGKYLVDIYGQHAHQSLLRPIVQQTLLDIYGDHAPVLNKLSKAYQRWQQVSQELKTLTQAASERATRSELLRYQIEELSIFQPKLGELQQLEQEQQQLVHRSELIQGSEAVLDLLYQDDQRAIYVLLSQVSRRLGQMQVFDPSLSKLTIPVEGALIQINEAANELRQYLDSMEINPERLVWIEERLSEFYELTRKYRVTADELPVLAERLALELANLETVDVRLDRLQQELAALSKEYQELSKCLSESRSKVATALEQEVTRAMQLLAMPGGCFKVTLVPLKEDKFSPYGTEQIQFQVNTNPGQLLGPLNKIASGGELSRIGLAIQALISQRGGASTLVFDEVDVGVSGAVAEVVGVRLRELGKYRQVICVTHLPQVAAQAHSQIRISKHHHEGTTTVELVKLSEDERVEEIARMLGGKDVTDRSRAHAYEMLGAAWQNEVH
ncbi:DNA repair protein RecN [Candidatus Nitrosoglobus terrae]|uniref:DNA repair protein RecN n=1 Tax=Candidatus Nitrosoglobus terrae TaxID=1630141 RepID=A0A1Q2SNX2_9GAMM|nr:DNA repair protein RecN [Candidatus Nitrosoglobus terrae]BAW80803.1 DNA repair protein RecN [Candidatus Nitrosoglobus terrae]